MPDVQIRHLELSFLFYIFKSIGNGKIVLPMFYPPPHPAEIPQKNNITN